MNPNDEKVEVEKVDKWRPWFEDQTTEQLFKYWIENEHYDLGDSWSSVWRKRKHE